MKYKSIAIQLHRRLLFNTNCFPLTAWPNRKEQKKKTERWQFPQNIICLVYIDICYLPFLTLKGKLNLLLTESMVCFFHYYVRLSLFLYHLFGISRDLCAFVFLGSLSHIWQCDAMQVRWVICMYMSTNVCTNRRRRLKTIKKCSEFICDLLPSSGANEQKTIRKCFYIHHKSFNKNKAKRSRNEGKCESTSSITETINTEQKQLKRWTTME